jgi:hypothetical protein
LSLGVTPSVTVDAVVVLRGLVVLVEPCGSGVPPDGDGDVDGGVDAGWSITSPR